MKKVKVMIIFVFSLHFFSVDLTLRFLSSFSFCVYCGCIFVYFLADDSVAYILYRLTQQIKFIALHFIILEIFFTLLFI
jgi:hypothetical protein